MLLVAALAAEELRVVTVGSPGSGEGCLEAGGEFRALPGLDDLAWPQPEPLFIAAFLGGLTERLTPWMCEQLADAGADAVLRDSFALYGQYAAGVNGTLDFAVPAMMAFHGGMWPRPDGPRESCGAAAARGDLRAASRRMGRRYGKPLGRRSTSSPGGAARRPS